MNEYNINDILRVASENTNKEYRQVKTKFYNGLVKQENELPPMAIDVYKDRWNKVDSA